MSTVHVAIVKVRNSTANSREAAMVASSLVCGTPESITSSGSNVVATLTATRALLGVAASADAASLVTPDVGNCGFIWRIANMGTEDIYVAFGSAPTANATTATSVSRRYGCPAGGVFEFGISQIDEKMAVTNV